MSTENALAPYAEIATPIDAHIALALECDLDQLRQLSNILSSIVARKLADKHSMPVRWTRKHSAVNEELKYWRAVLEATNNHAVELDPIPF